MTSGAPILDASGIAQRFGGVLALDGASLTVGRSEIVGLIGPNGSGKSTMVNLVAGEMRPDAGTIRFDGTDITAFPPYKRARLGLARSFQMLRLFRSLSVEENLALAGNMRMKTSMLDTVLARRPAEDEERRLRARARDLLAWFELDSFAGQPVAALSIGQQRMVELARGMISDPKLFVLDEPAAGLSPPNVDRLITLIRRMRDEFGMSILIVEHDMRVVRDLCDRVAVLDAGRIIAEGRPDAVTVDPAVVEAYIGSGWRRRAGA